MNLQDIMITKAEAAMKAADAMTLVSTDTKNKALLAMADMLEKHADVIIEANKKDMLLAEEKGVKKSYLDRLLLTNERIAGMADGLRQAAALPDPVGEGYPQWIK